MKPTADTAHRIHGLDRVCGTRDHAELIVLIVYYSTLACSEYFEFGFSNIPRSTSASQLSLVHHGGFLVQAGISAHTHVARLQKICTAGLDACIFTIVISGASLGLDELNS